MIKEMCKYIEAQVASLSMSGAGRNLYAGNRATNAPDASTVVETPIPDPTDGQLLDKVDRTFRIECRGAINNYFSAHDVAQSIHDAIHGDMQVSLPVVGSITYMVNIMATEPSALSPDEKHRPRIVLYLYCETQEL